jgi:hypothetical protein
VVAGNGSFDYAGGGKNLGESYIKLGSSDSLPVLDYFTPFDYASLNPADADTGSAGVALLAGCGKTPISGEICNPHYAESAGRAP